MRSPVKTAVALAGGMGVVARRLEISKQAVWWWTHVGRVPADRVLELEQLCQGRVTRHELRPDLYP